MTSKTRYAVKFGDKAPIPVEKATYHGAILTKAVDEIRVRIDEAIEQLAQITSVRKAHNKDFCSKMICRTQRNLYITIGYGKNNELFSHVLEGFFDCPVNARTALQKQRKFLVPASLMKRLWNSLKLNVYVQEPHALQNPTDYKTSQKKSQPSKFIMARNYSSLQNKM